MTGPGLLLGGGRSNHAREGQSRKVVKRRPVGHGFSPVPRFFGTSDRGILKP
jgi:hypothetical protein